jgi:hypothetical protein
MLYRNFVNYCFFREVSIKKINKNIGLDPDLDPNSAGSMDPDTKHG